MARKLKIAGLFAPAISTFIHRTTAHFISLFCYPHPYKNRSPQLITPPRFAPFCRTLSPLISVHKALPWQIKSTRILMFFPPKKPYFAVICRVMPLSKMYKVLLQCHVTLIFSTYLGIS